MYEGAKDFIVLSKGKRMTAAVLYPITSKQRKYLNKIGSSRNTFINHLLWIQKNNKDMDMYGGLVQYTLFFATFFDGKMEYIKHKNY